VRKTHPHHVERVEGADQQISTRNRLTKQKEANCAFKDIGWWAIAFPPSAHMD
jgi:hypothetical protein